MHNYLEKFLRVPDEKSDTMIELLNVSLQIACQHLQNRSTTHSSLDQGTPDCHANDYRKTKRPDVLTLFGQMMCGANMVARLMADILLTC